MDAKKAEENRKYNKFFIVLIFVFIFCVIYHLFPSNVMWDVRTLAGFLICFPGYKIAVWKLRLRKPPKPKRPRKPWRVPSEQEIQAWTDRHTELFWKLFFLLLFGGLFYYLLFCIPAYIIFSAIIFIPILLFFFL